MIFKSLQAYSFRVDLSNNEQSTAEIVKFFEKYNVKKYYGNPELGEETQKPHYQMIIWMVEKTAKEITTMRNYWRGKVQTKKGGGVSLKKARDERKLFGYCRKEEKSSILTNISKKIYLPIKKYKTLTALKVQKREKLEKIIGGISQKISNFEYLCALEKAYLDVYGRPTFRKNYYLENLRKAGYMTSKHVIATVFPHGIEADSYLTDDWRDEPIDNHIEYEYFGDSSILGVTKVPTVDCKIEVQNKLFRKKELKNEIIR